MEIALNKTAQETYMREGRLFFKFYIECFLLEILD